MSLKNIGAVLHFLLKILVLVLPVILIIGLITGLLTNGLYAFTSRFFGEQTTNYLLFGLLILAMGVHYLLKFRKKK